MKTTPMLFNGEVWEILCGLLMQPFNSFPPLLGWHQYRVKFIYRDKTGRNLFEYITTIGVRKRKLIEDHRKIKIELGPIYYVRGVPGNALCNGELIVEPVCYLGRWK